MILTVDLGTSVTKAALWEPGGLLGVERARLETFASAGGHQEQDPRSWWTSVTKACRGVLGQIANKDVDVIGFSAARQSLVPVDGNLLAIRNGLLWSDRRATTEAEVLSGILGGADELRRRTGLFMDPGAVGAKLLWLVTHEADSMRRTRWILTPRDLVVWRMTGAVATDLTIASASGLYDREGDVLEELAAAIDSRSSLSRPLRELLPEPLPSSRVVGELLEAPAGELGLRPGVPVVIGAGDRACEVIGAGASADRPMVSWGTTANVSVPVRSQRAQIPLGMIATRSADSGWLFEGGVSGAGSLVDWIGGICRTGTSELVEMASASPPGARGVTVLPWLGGARAPWWDPGASAQVLGLRADHGLPDIARAAIEGVAWDLARCIDAADRLRDVGFFGLVLGGGGSSIAPWVDVLTAVTGLSATRRRSGEAASAGAAVVAGAGVGLGVDLDTMDPVVSEVVPDPSNVEAYSLLRPRADALAARAISEGRAPVL